MLPQLRFGLARVFRLQLPRVQIPSARESPLSMLLFHSGYLFAFYILALFLNSILNCVSACGVKHSGCQCSWELAALASLQLELHYGI